MTTNEGRDEEIIPLNPLTKQRISQNYAANGGIVPNSQANEGQDAYQANPAIIPNHNQPNAGHGRVINPQRGPFFRYGRRYQGYRPPWVNKALCCGCIFIIVIVVIVIILVNVLSDDDSMDCGHANRPCCSTDVETYKCLADEYMKCSVNNICEDVCGGLGEPCCNNGFGWVCGSTTNGGRSKSQKLRCMYGHGQDGQCNLPY